MQQNMECLKLVETQPVEWMTKTGTIASVFPVKEYNTLFSPKFELNGDLVDITNNFISCPRFHCLCRYLL